MRLADHPFQIIEIELKNKPKAEIALTSATFGQITNIRVWVPMRELQLSLKLVF